MSFRIGERIGSEKIAHRRKQTGGFLPNVAEPRRVDEAAEFGCFFEQVVKLPNEEARVLVLHRRQPFLARGADAEAGAGDAQRRQRDRPPDQPPRGKGDIEGRKLRAAGVEFQPVEDFPEHDAHGFLDAQLFLLAQHGHQELEQRDEEMPRTAARIEHPQLAHGLRPAGERAGRRRAVVFAPQIRERNGRGAPRGLDLRRPPRAERVVKQKLDHVMLGEELGDGGERVGVDLVAGFVDRVFFLRAPELIDPAKRVVGTGRPRRAALRRVSLAAGDAPVQG